MPHFGLLVNIRNKDPYPSFSAMTSTQTNTNLICFIVTPTVIDQYNATERSLQVSKEIEFLTSDDLSLHVSYHQFIILRVPSTSIESLDFDT